MPPDPYIRVMQIRYGADIFLDQGDEYRDKRLGLVTNEAAVLPSGKPARQALLSAKYRLVKLFSPEHGLERRGEDGKPMPDGRDALTGLPVISLYGDKLEPGEEDLADIDLLLFDLPDIGCRFYTYLWTLHHVMIACHRHHKPLLVLDRPNPLSGNMELAEGPVLDEEHCASFIGRWPVLLRHSCTFGELARYGQATRLPGLDLRVIRMEGWERNSFQRDLGLPFVPTSPAMTTAEAALLYPGLGLLEATNLSEGRGTAYPFRMAGAPWLDNIRISAKFNELHPPGVVAEPVDAEPVVANGTVVRMDGFTSMADGSMADALMPGSGKYHGQPCHWVRFRVSDPLTFRPVHSAMLFIKLVKDWHSAERGLHGAGEGGYFSWSPYPTHVNPSGAGHLDLLLGRPGMVAFFEQSFGEFARAVPGLLRCDGWEETMRPYLLY
jgi:uncharacterized protein YbbC (DUF1343 family)